MSQRLALEMKQKIYIDEITGQIKCLELHLASKR
jgi:hypothetical protein